MLNKTLPRRQVMEDAIESLIKDRTLSQAIGWFNDYDKMQNRPKLLYQDMRENLTLLHIAQGLIKLHPSIWEHMTSQKMLRIYIANATNHELIQKAQAKLFLIQ